MKRRKSLIIAAMKFKNLNFDKVRELLKKHEHMSPHTRDRLALLAGFQSWKEMQDTLLEESDEDSESKKNEK